MDINNKEYIKNILSNLPDKPGVYQYFDSTGKIIYIGKAKNLKKRVNSYFNRDTHDNNKIRVLVNRISDIKYIIVDTELDALLLENNLIKKYQPRYNVLLKDDKTFPWICIKKEPFPRVFSTRNIIKDGSTYYGPYASLKMMHTIFDLIKQLFPLRNCYLNLSQENISKGKFKVCLEYHIGNCKGPCEALQTEEDYMKNILAIHEIIKGNIFSVIKELKKKMIEFANEYQFEKAQAIKEKIDTLNSYQSKSTIVNPSINNVDVFSIISDESYGYVNFLKVINGAIIQSHTLELKKKLQETDNELLCLSIAEIRQRFESDSKEVIVPFKPEFKIPGIQFIIPQKGDKRDLLELSERNAKYFKKERTRQAELIDPERHTKRILSQMMSDLHLDKLPKHIECFDNSNIQGKFPVAAMVVFKDAKPVKNEYRHFNIKTVEGPDDYASMEEVIFRRYKRMIDENLILPDLIVIDGGKGQLNSALISLEKLDLRKKISVISIAKKLEEIFFPDDPVPLYLDKRSETLKVIQQLRDEAHRFGITHHRNKRSKETIKTELTDINGIGKNIADKLLKEFKSVHNIKELTKEELINAIGKAKGKIVFDYFNNKS